MNAAALRPVLGCQRRRRTLARRHSPPFAADALPAPCLAAAGMASTRNAYELLLGGGAPAAGSTGAAKKKKNKKKGGGGAAAGEAQPAAAPAAPAPAPVPAPTQPQVQSLRDAAEGLEAAAVAAQAGERGALAQDWADQVRRAVGLGGMYGTRSGLAC